MQFDKSLFIFRRDLRLFDNLALLEAVRSSKKIIPVFIFDPRQLSPHPYRSLPGMNFLFNSLKELSLEIKQAGGELHTFHGLAEEVLAEIIKTYKLNAVFCSRDYSPFAIRREKATETVCKNLNCHYAAAPNLLLNEPEKINTQTGKKYSIFTPFYKASSSLGVAKPVPVENIKFEKLKSESNLPFFSIDQARDRYYQVKNSSQLLIQGGRTEALSLLSKIKQMADYKEQRNLPALSATTNLSTHNKFGTLSIREVHNFVSNTFNSQHTLCTELYWRDFLTHIGFNFPHVFSSAFNKVFDKVEWEENDEYLLAWQEGRTGFPIVDAGMRELNETGFMHNRVRMIVASFLTKDLLLDWHHGERYFAQKLLDFDPAVNNGNWQWAASTGCDAQPYFRIFNPWLQSEKFDPQALYIKRWIPELTAFTPKQIHNWFKETAVNSSYPKPIIDHAEQKKKALRLFEIAKG